MTSSANNNHYKFPCMTGIDSAHVIQKAIPQSPEQSTTYTCRSTRLDSYRVSVQEAEIVLLASCLNQQRCYKCRIRSPAFTYQINSLSQIYFFTDRDLFFLAYFDLSISLELLYESRVWLSAGTADYSLQTVTYYKATEESSFHVNGHAIVIFQASPNHD